MTTIKRWLIALVASLLAATVGHTAELLPVDVEADQLRFDKASGRYYAEGNVELRYRGLLLQGEQVWWHPELGHAGAQGQVAFESDTETLEAETFWLDLRDQTGFATNGHLFFKNRNLHVRGASLQRRGPNDYRIEQGRFTTCDGEVAAWSFGADEVDVTLGGYARAKNTVMYLRDVPVLYSPWLAYPVKPERESGFLTPQAGYSSRKGLELSLAWYQVIADNQDITFYADYLSKLGVGLGGEYRYIFRDDNAGELKFYSILGLDQVPNQQAFAWQHKGHLAPRLRLLADAEWVSDKDYFDDFGDLIEETTKDRVESDVSLIYHQGRGVYGGRVQFTRLLDMSNDNTLQRLPELRADFLRQPIGDWPVYTLMDHRYTYFYRDHGERGHRVSLRPAVAATTDLLGVVELEGQVGWLHRIYWAENAQEAFAQQGNVDAELRLSSRLSRRFDRPGQRYDQLLHSIEPELRYQIRPSIDESDQPFFDRLDRQETTHVAGVGVINRLVARPSDPEEGEPLEWLYLRLSQEFDIRQHKHDRHKRTGVDPWRAIRAELVLRPTEHLYLDIDSRYQLSGRELERFTAEMGVDDQQGNYLKLGYRYDRDDLEYAYGAMETSWLAPVYLGYRNRYDLTGPKRLEHTLRAEYRQQCWSLFAELTDRIDETAVLFGFSLSGVSKVNSFGGSLSEDL